MRKIAVLTSGGDAPGMNAAVRAVTRTAIADGLAVVGVEHGYEGLISGWLRPMELTSVSGIINHGGTILRSARSERFKAPEGQRAAATTIEREGISGVAVIGGDGSYRGALALNRTCGVNVIGLPGTIDNDIPGTRYSIGFDTAVNTALDAIDRIRDTSESHGRVFVVEVMGRAHGGIALEVAVAGGAEAVVLPEHRPDIGVLCQRIKAWQDRGKRSCIVVVAEGAARGADVAAAISQVTGTEARLTVLGHIQRGGTPTARDRTLATLLGFHAARLLRDGRTNLMVGVAEGSEVVYNDLTQVLDGTNPLDLRLLDVVEATAS